MKKLILVFILVLGLALPLSAKAATKSLNLKEALQEEEIELNKAFDSYKETEFKDFAWCFAIRLRYGRFSGCAVYCCCCNISLWCQ